MGRNRNPSQPNPHNSFEGAAVKNHAIPSLAHGIALGLVAMIGMPAMADDSPRVLIDPGVAESWEGGRLAVDHADVSPVDTPDGKKLRFTVSEDGAQARFRLVFKEPYLDLFGYRFVEAELRNPGERRVRVQLGVRSPANNNRAASRDFELEPGESVALRVTLRRIVPKALKDVFFGMRGFPELMDPERGIDASQVKEVFIGIRDAKAGQTLEIGRVAAVENFARPSWWDGDTARLFPMIDAFGQYAHGDWPGKVHDETELRGRIAEEQADLAAHPGPEAWTPFGGWATGPQLEATGHFYPKKHEGRWWLVDPTGRLFWSHGTDCVRATTAYTPITDREHYFADLPPRDTALGAFYGRGNWAPHGYYQNKGAYTTYCFSAANLLRKYGADWEARFNELAHVRLRSWGLNTIGNWSDPALYRMSKTSYTVTLGAGARRIEGSTGYWGKFADPFDPDFDRNLKAAAEREAETSARDPWCIGYFVDNELAWGDELSLAVAALQSPADQPAKVAFLADLKAKYETIDALNRAWGTEHASWDALLSHTEAPDKEKAHDDLAAFYTRIAEEYFRRCREAVKAAAPNKLYLGCRFAWVNDRAIRAAAKYCDVISFNRYEISVRDLRLPEGLDLPVVIGEFHFGALDRGMFHTGLRETADQKDRADAYRRYVRGALENPLIVGTHWFQFVDQATTGRGDGENYQIGFLDVCDTPYPELRAAAREIGQTMYSYRAGAASRP